MNIKNINFDRFNATDNYDEFIANLMELRSLFVAPYADVPERFIHAGGINKELAIKLYIKEYKKFKREKLKHSLIGFLSKTQVYPGHVFYGRMISLMNLLKTDLLTPKQIEYVIENASYLHPEYFMETTKQINK